MGEKLAMALHGRLLKGLGSPGRSTANASEMFPGVFANGRMPSRCPLPSNALEKFPLKHTLGKGLIPMANMGQAKEEVGRPLPFPALPLWNEQRWQAVRTGQMLSPSHPSHLPFHRSNYGNS